MMKKIGWQMCRIGSVIVMACLLCASVQRSVMAETSGPGTPIRLAPPRVAAAVLPADGSGTYRVVLDGAFGASSLTLHLVVKDGKVVDGIGLDLEQHPCWMPLDVAGLTFKAGTLTGTALLTVPGRPILHGERDKRKELNPEQVPDLAQVEVKLDCRYSSADAVRGTGTWSVVWKPEGKAPPVPFYDAKPKCEGALSAWREAPAIEPPTQLELAAPLGLGDVMIPQNGLILRARLGADGGATLVTGSLQGENPHVTLPSVEAKGKMSLTGGRLNGEIAVVVKYPGPVNKRGESTGPTPPEVNLTWKVTGRSLGRFLVANLTVGSADKQWQTVAIGRWVGAGAPIPMASTSGAWTWQQDLPVDTKLQGLAKTESVMPVFPGEPGKRAFWTWRRLVMSDSLAVIHPPSFDIRPVAGAASYRVTLKAKASGKQTVILLDQPWKPWAQGWADLEPGLYTPTIEALDANNTPMAAVFKMGVLDKESGQPAEVDLPRFTVVKKPCFSGPYSTPPRRPTEGALMAARWSTEAVTNPYVRGLGDVGFSEVGGEAGASWRAAGQIWSFLAVRALSGDAGERAAAEMNLDAFVAGLQVNQRASVRYFPYGIFYCYKGYTPLTRYGGEALLDVWRETGDERSREMVLRMGEALTKMQSDRGTWVSVDKSGKPAPPAGFFNWKHATEFGAAEMLYVLGRIRTELKTEQFVETERKSREYVEREQVGQVFWPISVHHSMSLGYPVWQYPQSTCYYIRYLLEHAPSRDLALAEDLGRWVEDTAVDWSRAGSDGLQSPSQPVRPTVSSGDRYNGEPGDNAMFIALAFLRLHEATGKPLWLAKADALATAVLMAQEPQSGFVNPNLSTRGGEGMDVMQPYYHGRCFISGHAAQLWREYDALRVKITGAPTTPPAPSTLPRPSAK